MVAVKSSLRGESARVRPSWVVSGGGGSGPLTGAKDHGGLDGVADVEMTGEAEIANEGGQGDEAGEPEEHGQGLDGEQDKGMSQGRQEGRCQGQIGQGQKGPDGLCGWRGRQRRG